MPPPDGNLINRIVTSAFGIGMPVLSPSWTDGTNTLPTSSDNDMSLLISDDDKWLAPISGTIRRVETNDDIQISLAKPNGSFVTGPGMLLTTFPQAYLRLSRLYVKVLETSSMSRPEQEKGYPARPVPRYFFYKGSLVEGNISGNVNPEDEIGFFEEMTIFDDFGLPIDPLAVAAAFQAIMDKHKILQHRAFNTPFVSDHQVKRIAEIGGSSPVVRIRLSGNEGIPYDGSQLRGMTNDINSAIGLFTLNASSGSGSDLTGRITKESGTGDTGAFPDEDRHLLLIGLATTGRLGDEVEFPSLPTNVSLNRDFFSIRVVQLKTFLLGSPNQHFNGSKVERSPSIRIHEPINLLGDGNDVVAAANIVLSGTIQEGLCVAQSIDGNFSVPAEIGPNAHWPNFPPTTGASASAGDLPIDLRNNFNPTAQYFDDGNSSTANIDVVLTLNGLPAGSSARVYPRKFIEDAREARSDGAGGIVPDSGRLSLLLRDPFSLRKPGISDDAITIPTTATLRFDVMVVKRTTPLQARLYGNISLPIDSTSTTSSAPSQIGTNRFATASRRGISNSGILGLGTHTGSLPNDALQAILALTGEANPRDASRWPTMARRDLLVAGLSSGKWRGVIAGGRLTKEIHSAEQRLGAPGSLGGRETQVVGVFAQNGKLAYDIARMALRRTTNIIVRLGTLSSDNWNEPSEPSVLPAGSPANENSGTFAGAILQTIAPFCETPEINIVKDYIDNNLDSIPTNFNDFVDLIGTHLIPGGIPFRTEIINALNNLKNNNTLDESKRERLFNELHRETMSSCYGRRDAQWALRDAISAARRFIYIESPGFTSTQTDYGPAPVPPYAVDLIKVIADRMQQAPALRVIICTPKYPDFAPGYEPMAAYEKDDRRRIILDLPTARDPLSSRVIAFHPIGFPGRSSRLESTVVIIDDIWALVGSSTFRRRGLTFDGGSDIVFTDTELVNGRCLSITNFRRKLMASRLGISSSETNEFGTMPDPDFVRLSDGVEAFYTIRNILIAGGLGKIDRLWNGMTPGIDPIAPENIDLANPEGQEFQDHLVEALARTAIANLNSF